MITRSNSTRIVEGAFPCYVRVNMQSWMLRTPTVNPVYSEQLLDYIDQTCMKHFNKPFDLAKSDKFVFFRMGTDIWTIGFRTQEPMDTFLALIDSAYDGSAFVLKNTKHLAQLEEFQAFNWEILPEGLNIDSRFNTRFALFVNKTDETVGIVEKFLKKHSKDKVSHRQTKTFHVLYFDEASLVLEAKLMFPNIDKIEHFINVNELGEANE